MKVTVISKELILPSSPTPCNLKTYKLSYIDQQISPHHISFLLYCSYDEATSIPQSEMIIRLKTSLSTTLTHYYPLAGRLPENQNNVDCNDQGVQFLVAEIGCNLMNIIRSPVIEDLNQLVVVESSYVEEQLAIQVNLFDCGGIAVGVSISHRIADACSFSSFVRHWSIMSKGSETPLMGPLFNSAVLFPSMESHEYRRKRKEPTIHKNVVTKRFVFSSLAINELKCQVDKSHSTLANATRVEVVTALLWKCGMVALGDCKASVAAHVVNFRRKMVPSLQDQQFGNLIQLASAVAHQSTDIASLVAKLRASLEMIDNEYLKSLIAENGVEIAKENFNHVRKFMIQEDVRVFRFSSWCRFEFNESDFGWGKPIWVSTANFSNEKSIIFMDSISDNGIEAWVVMKKDDMLQFEQDAELQAFVCSTTS